MTSIEPELWVDRPAAAVAFYAAAFGATVVHRVGEGEDIVAQLTVGDAAFWVASTDPSMKRLDPLATPGRTSRTLLVVDDPDQLMQRATSEGATETSQVTEEHGWRLGRIIDPFGHEWEIGKPSGAWPAQTAITRMWRGWTRAEEADDYERFLIDELFPSMRSIPGFIAADVLRSADGDEVAFVTLTRFRSIDDIRAFAGDEFELPVIEPRAAELLSHYDEQATHFETSFFNR